VNGQEVILTSRWAVANESDSTKSGTKLKCPGKKRSCDEMRSQV
jgi:hypothetical protein